jgi:hydroxymethylbilane synthase
VAALGHFVTINPMKTSLIIGTRKSPLALWQSEYIKARLMECFPALKVELKHIVTRGDRTQEANLALPEIGGKGLFTLELEEALIAREIDLAVHSLKDLPTILSPEFAIGAIPVREVVEDVLISRSGSTLRDLPSGAVIGTSSLRRSSQLLRIRPDLKVEHIRGNVETRIRKACAADGLYDATVLARAGLVRLGLERHITEVLTLDEMLPAPGQGALGIECRADDQEVRDLLQPIHHPTTALAVTAERAFLAALNAGCNTPVAAYAEVKQIGSRERWVFQGRCFTGNGDRVIEVRGESELSSPHDLGVAMAREAIAAGFTLLS